jgi:hypothetical protein
MVRLAWEEHDTRWARKTVCWYFCFIHPNDVLKERSQKAGGKIIPSRMDSLSTDCKVMNAFVLLSCKSFFITIYMSPPPREDPTPLANNMCTNVTFLSITSDQARPHQIQEKHTVQMQSITEEKKKTDQEYIHDSIAVRVIRNRRRKWHHWWRMNRSWHPQNVFTTLNRKCKITTANSRDSIWNTYLRLTSQTRDHLSQSCIFQFQRFVLFSHLNEWYKYSELIRSLKTMLMCSVAYLAHRSRTYWLTL